MNPFWMFVSVAGIVLVGAYGISLWWEAIRDLLRPIPPEVDED